MTSVLLNSCRTKNKLYKSFIKHPTEQNKNAFISYRNGFSKLKMAAKKSYYNNLFSEYKCKMRKTWNLIKSLIGHKTGSTDNTFHFLMIMIDYLHHVKLLINLISILPVLVRESLIKFLHLLMIHFIPFSIDFSYNP